MVASPARPTSLSRQISHTTTASDKDIIASITEWTEEQERRLLYCQSELKGAQRRWSESQELWIEEYNTLTFFRNQVEHLTELKKARLKAQKRASKQQAQAREGAALGKKKVFSLSRRSSKANTGTNTPVRGSLSRVNSGINAFIANGLPRRSTEPYVGSGTPATGGLSRRSSGGVSGNEAYDGDDNDDEDDDSDGSDVSEDEDDDDDDDKEDEQDTLGKLTYPSTKSTELPPSTPPPLPRRSSLTYTLRRLSMGGIRRRSTGPDSDLQGRSGSPSLGGAGGESPGGRRRG
ncbi:hypothetical protein N7G274_004836 [Stereocaulon virgatum]|uniref:Uncharacterized protein n=1 Tax=Stereocaulon virgatum TaxID=373712 RepID=A0ABR4ACW5_9LECA